MELNLRQQTATNSEVTVAKDGNEVPLVELDSKIKERQIKKLDHEIAQFEKSWPRVLETTQKLVIPILLLFGAIVALVLEIPQNIKKANEAVKAKDVAEGANRTLQESYEKLETTYVDLQRTKERLETDIALKNKSLLKLDEEYQRKQEITLSKNDTATSNKDVGAINEIKKQSGVFLDQIFIQFAGDLRRDDINSLRAELGKSGFSAPPAERVNHGANNVVRYFSKTEAERGRAEMVALVINDFFPGRIAR